MAGHASRQTRPLPAVAAQVAAEAEAYQARCNILATLDCLRDVPASERDRLVSIGVFRAFAPGSTIMSEQRLGEFLYIVLRGSVRVTLHDRDGREVLLAVLDKGDCCGEGPLFGEFFRRATAYAERPCNLLQLPLAAVRALLPDVPHLADALRRIYRQRLSDTTLGRVPLFNQLSTIDRSTVAALLQSSFHERGTEIVTQGKIGSALYLIEAGQAVIERDGQPLAHMGEGDFFGEMSLLDNKPHNATVRALTPITVLALPAHDFHRLLQRNPDLSERLQQVVSLRRAAGTSMQSDRDRARQLTVAVQDGLLRGTHLLVRDPALCPPDCKICETACGERHGKPRLHINGTAVAGLDVLDTCRQCRVSPECVEVCPEDALVWDNRGALVVNNNCTGCGKCVDACPYDALERIPLETEPSGPLWHLWNSMRRLRHPVIPLELTDQPRHRAAKCDLCHGHSDMACLTACPTGSLRFVPVEELFPL